MRFITLNSSNLVSQGTPFTNVYEYRFPSTQKFEEGDMVALSGCNIYYSNFNFSSALNNNSLVLYWPQATGVAYTAYTLTIPDGMYDITALNSWLQYEMISRRMYLIDGNGDFVYFCEIVSNFNYYAFQINTYQVPSALPSGYSQPPSGFLNFSAALLHPNIEIPATNIRTNLGFNAARYPPSGTNTATPYSVLSQNVPQITDQNTFLVRCSLAFNRFASDVDDVIFAFSPKTEFASLLSISQDKYVFNSIRPGYYSSFRIVLIDENFNNLRLQDPNSLISLVIWRKSEDGTYD